MRQAFHKPARLKLTSFSTIHSMVYNAMKLFMEINPQLFDECSHEYTETQNSAEQRQQTRQSKWDMIAEQAKRGQANGPSATPRGGPSAAKGSSVSSPLRGDEVDPATQDSQKRLDALRLQDEGVTKDYRDGSDWRLRDYERQNLAATRNQR